MALPAEEMSRAPTVCRAVAVTVDVTAAVAVLEDDVRAGRLRGAQLYLRTADDVVDIALGTAVAGPARPTDVGRLYCAVKPLISVAVGIAQERGLVSWDDPVSRFVEVADSRRHRDMTVRSLLTHRSGLPYTYVDASAESYETTLRRALRTDYPDSRWTAHPSYNNSLAWHALAAVVAAVFAEPVAAVVEREIARPLALPALRLVDPDPDTYVPTYVYRGERGFDVAPGADAEAVRTRPDPGEGGFGSAGDLGRFMAELGMCARGAGTLLRPETMRAMIRSHGAVDYGGHDATWGLGIELGVRPGLFGAGWPADWFGHAGGAGRRNLVLALANASADVALAVRQYSVDARATWRLVEVGRRLRPELERYAVQR